VILDAHAVTSHQTCRRDYLLALDYQVIRYRAKSLFDSLLRRAIIRLSAGDAAASVCADARTAFLTAAANPGLDLPAGADPYAIAKEWCAMLDTVPRAIARLVLLTVKPSAIVQLSPSVGWRVLANMDDTGTLHRWITVDRWDGDALAREMHGWYVFGDMAMLGAPLMIHAIEIGGVRHGRRASAWSRGWRHPHTPNLGWLRFRHTDGSAMKGWTPVYLADHAHDITADEWVDAMTKDGEALARVHHVTLNAPDEATCEDTRQQLVVLAREMEQAAVERGSTTWRAAAMSRGACDGMVPCRWQHACYSPATGTDAVTDPTSTGLYRRRVDSTLAPVKQHA
jgi:nitrite reductase/ring-hydroxylating ferredoxin subunit